MTVKLQHILCCFLTLKTMCASLKTIVFLIHLNWCWQACSSTHRSVLHVSRKRLLESRVRENGNSQEEWRDSTTKIGDNGQDLLISRVQLSPGDILETWRRLVTGLYFPVCIISSWLILFLTVPILNLHKAQHLSNHYYTETLLLSLALIVKLVSS